MRHCGCWKDEPEPTFGDLHREEPRIEWTEQHLGNRLTHLFFPHHYARVMVAREIQRRYADA